MNIDGPCCNCDLVSSRSRRSDVHHLGEFERAPLEPRERDRTSGYPSLAPCLSSQPWSNWALLLRAIHQHYALLT